jgi:hypothetical protein
VLGARVGQSMQLEGPSYSWRRASIGSSDAARRAGIDTAAKATPTTSTVATRNVPALPPRPIRAAEFEPALLPTSLAILIPICWPAAALALVAEDEYLGCQFTNCAADVFAAVTGEPWGGQAGAPSANPREPPAQLTVAMVRRTTAARTAVLPVAS